MKQLNSKTIFWTAWLASLVLFFYPFPVSYGAGFGLDKVAHFVIFAVLGFYGFRTYSQKIYHTFLSLASYAFVIEYIQGHFLPSRSLDWYDAIAGVVGLAAVYFHHRQTKK